MARWNRVLVGYDSPTLNTSSGLWVADDYVGHLHQSRRQTQRQSRLTIIGCSSNIQQSNHVIKFNPVSAYLYLTLSSTLSKCFVCVSSFPLLCEFCLSLRIAIYLNYCLLVTCLKEMLTCLLLRVLINLWCSQSFWELPHMFIFW